MPLSASTILYKLSVTGALGAIGGLIMALFDPPKSRKELVFQGMTAGIASMVFGPTALEFFLDHYDFFDPNNREWVIPIYFLVGALSWGGFAALAKLRQLIARFGAAKIADQVDLPRE